MDGSPFVEPPSGDADDGQLCERAGEEATPVFGDADAPIVVELAQNQICKAFREVGRVMRTVALLRFLADSGLRARVTAATNKAEAYNGFSAWTPVRQPRRNRRERPGRAGKVGQMNSLLCT
jgi:Tn3 transposase DDE domain